MGESARSVLGVAGERGLSVSNSISSPGESSNCGKLKNANGAEVSLFLNVAPFLLALSLPGIFSPEEGRFEPQAARDRKGVFRSSVCVDQLVTGRFLCAVRWTGQMKKFDGQDGEVIASVFGCKG